LGKYRRHCSCFPAEYGIGKIKQGSHRTSPAAEKSAQKQEKVPLEKEMAAAGQ